jgi:threonine dehydratase
MVELKDILSAQQNIAGKVHRTPLMPATTLGNRVNMNLYLKAEVFQKTGSFKPRGAVNKLSQLTDEERKRGVIGLSSGNHAQGLAYAASLFGVAATLVMPRTTQPNKIGATKGYGAEVVLTEGYPKAEETCMQLQKERNLVLVHPYNDPYIVAGQGTTGLEILEDLPSVDVVFVPIGGGGLISGIAAAIKSNQPSVKVIGVEAIGAPAMRLSLQQKKVVHLETTNTVADGLSPPDVGEINLALAQKYIDDVVLVSDDELTEAMWTVIERCKIVVEPSGAAGAAAVLFRKTSLPAGSQVVCVLSGGNINRSRLASLASKE